MEYLAATHPLIVFHSKMTWQIILFPILSYRHGNRIVSLVPTSMTSQMFIIARNTHQIIAPIITFHFDLFLNRLTPVYMLVILMWTTLAPHFVTGPTSYTLYTDFPGYSTSSKTVCQQYWWTNLLYINNLYPVHLGEEVGIIHFIHYWRIWQICTLNLP